LTNVEDVYDIYYIVREAFKSMHMHNKEENMQALLFG
jgi:hypothetical protein